MGEPDLQVRLLLEADEPVWLVGMNRIGRDRWHALHADHAADAEMDTAARRELQEALDVALVGASAVWEGDEGGERHPVQPVDAVEWYGTLPPDAWGELVEGAYRLSAPEPWDWAIQRLRRAPEFAVEVAVARAYRVPYSVLLSWDPDDRAIAVAQFMEERVVCPGCGVPARAMRDFDAAQVDIEECVWCGALAQARREASEEQHPRIRVREGR